ncbi:MAG: 50S ribosomal protein L23 [Chloroflexota bacterium]
MDLFEILRKPLVTEKNSALQAQGKYVFEVASGANKAQIKEAVQKAFKVRVTAVNVITVQGERRRTGRREIAGPPGKKAIVTLAPGNKIEIFEGV